jgi:hypothetical protein
VKKRQNGMTIAELQRWFAATPYEFINEAVKNCVRLGLVTQIGQRIKAESKPDLTTLRYQLALVLKEAQDDQHDYRMEGGNNPYVEGYLSALNDTIAAIDTGKVSCSQY